MFRFIRSDSVFRGAIRNIWPELLLIWYWLYPIRWRIRIAFRNVFIRSALFFLMMTSFYVLIEILFSLFEHVDVLAKLIEWSRLPPVPKLPIMPPTAEGVVLALGVLMAIHRIQEWRLRKREDKLPTAVSVLLKQIANLKGSAITDSAAIQNLITLVMEEFRGILETGTGRKITVSLMEKNTEDKLAIKCKCPKEAEFDEVFQLAQGEGGAGVAWKENELVYIPSIKHFIAIRVGQQYTPLGMVYKKTEKHPFKSLLCVPLATESNFYGVLTFSANKKGTFLVPDFEIARVAGSLVTVLKC